MSFLAPHPDSDAGQSAWVTIAQTLAAELARTAGQRERDGVLPRAEIQTLKDAGLVNLLIPRELGGEGGTFATALQVVKEISKGDGSIGALLSFQYKTSSVPRFFDPAGDAAEITRRSAAGRWFWGNLHVPEVEATPDGNGGFRVNGTKRWATAAGLGDVITVVARRTDVSELLFAVVPTDRPGLSVEHDWDPIGLRLAETVTVRTTDLEVRPDEVFPAQRPVVTLPALFLPVASALTAAFFVGSAQAAFERARDYTLTRPPRPFARHVGGSREPASRDVPTLARFGELWGALQAADALVRDAGEAIDALWSRRPDFTDDDVSALARIALAARANSQVVALDVTSSVYDISGTAATANTVGFDRHWRDVRTFAQHDPIAYVHKSIGANFLTGSPIGVPALV